MNSTLALFFGWLLRASGSAAVLTVLVLLAQFFLRKRLDARWRHLLWLLVLARLAMPFSPPSPASLFNYVRIEPRAEEISPVLKEAVSQPSPATGLEQIPAVAPSAPTLGAEQTPASLTQPSRPLPAPRDHWTFPGWPICLALIWAIGVGALGIRVIVQNVLFCRRLREGRLLDDPPTLEIFEQCKSLMGVLSNVRLIETEAVKSPAIYGLFRLRLLLPPGLTHDFTVSELSHVLLHELAHVRRRDIAAQWFVMCCQIAHWFNPILWLGFRRMAADREMACDELALSAAGEEHGRSYGQTIVKLVEAFSQTETLPGLVGILEDKEQIFQRVSMIARFKRHPRWSLAGAITIAALAMATLTGAQTETPKNPSPDLTGTVLLTNGQPANATVFIYTAGPKVGTSPFCPFCYPDCRKSATTDGQGHFKIESLDPQLLFRLLVVGQDSKPAFVPDIDPAKEPVRVTLQPRDLSKIAPDCIVLGQVFDKKGQPIKRATVEGEMPLFKHGEQGGGARDIDLLAVSDDRGIFTLTAAKPLAKLNLYIEAPGYAKRGFRNFTSGVHLEKLQLTEGATVKGRVVFNGKPLPSVSVGIVSADRMGDLYQYDAGTDANGQFTFLNLPPYVRYDLYTLMKTVQDRGAARLVTVNTEGDGSVTDAGDLAVEPAVRVSGRVVLADGKPIPPKTRLLVARQNAWDSMEIALAADGSFRFSGVPSDPIALSVRIPGYHPSVKNKSMDTLNPDRLLGVVRRDMTGLVILMEKRPPFHAHSDGMYNAADLPENRTLAGAEHADDHTGQRLISGKVTDKETGQPIASFKVTPRQFPQFESQVVDWNPQLAVDAMTNGSYEIYIPKAGDPYVLKVESPGYLPVVASPQVWGRSNFDFALTKGTGPSGVVLLPNGAPTRDAKVALLGLKTPENYMQLGAGGKINAFRDPRDLASTDDSGHFSFEPEVDMRFLAAAAPEGFKMVPIEAFKTNGQITLEPWAKVKGVLRRGGRPSANETLYLTFGGALKGQALDMFTPANTDENGAFEFDYVPAADCEIMAEEPTEDMPRRLNILKWFHTEAGQTAEVNIDAAEKAKVKPLAWADLTANRSFAAAPTKTLQGFVLLPDGKPAAGADVGFKDRHYNVLHIGDGVLVPGRADASIGHTTADGSFTVLWPSNATALCVACDAGVATHAIDGLTNGMRITLQPWGKVEGTMRLNNQTAPDKRIQLTQRLYDDSEFAVWPIYSVDSTTDENGRFSFAHVLPGRCTLTHWYDVGHGGGETSGDVTIQVKPGDTTNFVWGGKGRPVKGKLDMAPSNDLTNKQDFIVRIQPPFPLPPSISEITGHARQKEFTKWRRSEEGKAAMLAHSSYAARLEEDGTFQADDVVPGEYQLIVCCRFDNAEGAGRPGFSLIQVLLTNIIVPPLADPAKCEPYELGGVKVRASRPPQTASQSRVPKAGAWAPDFETKTLEGKPLSLAAYRGKFVLLDFCYMLAGGETEDLQSVSDAFSKDDRFVTISLCQDSDDDYVKQIKAKDAAHWIIGDLDFAALGEAYGLNAGAALPVIILVGPDGKILKSELRRDDIYASVAEALGKK